jgi:hypothetical protein
MSRNAERHALFQKYFEKLPPFVRVNHRRKGPINVRAEGDFRKARRALARALACGEWRKGRKALVKLS